MDKRERGEGIVVVGGQWGDEGKGRIIDILAKDSPVIARFQGGNNAGHSLHFDNKSLVLHLIPCGIVHKDKVAVIGNGVVLDPSVLFEEIASLEKQGFPVTPENLKISRHAHIILPIHKIIDRIREGSPLLHIGTTKRGIGPCYEDKVARFGIRAGDLLFPELLRTKLHRLLANRKGIDQESPEFTQQVLNYGAELKPYLCDTGEYLDLRLKAGARVLFEGAQGSLLDIDHGTYPFVTSANCVASHAAAGSGIGAQWFKEVLMVSKAYCTRVGEGPFFTEMSGSLEERFREQGREYGATTGRPRRCGWLDLPALKYAQRINGATGLILTKMDVLVGLGPFKVATSYQSGENKDLSYSDAMERFNQGFDVQVNYKEFAGVTEMSSLIRSREDLPHTLQHLLSFLEEELAIPVRMITFGPKRGQELMLSSLGC